MVSMFMNALVAVRAAGASVATRTRSERGASMVEYALLVGLIAVVGFLALTPSQLLAINQEDLTKELHQQNLPGTTWQYPNWGRKMRFTVEQLRTDPEARAYADMLRNWVIESGRGNGGMQAAE